MDDLMTVAEVAKKLHVSQQTVKRYIRNGILRGVQLQGLWRVQPVALDEFVRSRTTQVQEPENPIQTEPSP
jgi:excisionase family DNA binding protein